MKRYFSNPELKASSVILLLLITLFLCVTAFSLRLYYYGLKEDYTRSMGVVALRITVSHPELTSEIMPLITKEVASEEGKKGQEFLKQYGLSSNMENELFPYMNKTVARNSFTIILIFSIMAAVLFYLNYLQYAFFYRRVRSLTIGAKKVIEGDYDLAINENREGDLSKLAASFNSMREIIRASIGELKREKQFLVDLLSDISHQLKTPLSSMIVYNDIMLSKELSIDQRQTFLTNNQNQLNRMNWLIQSLLKLAKLDAKAIELQKEKQSMNETILEAIDALESKALENKVKINFIENQKVVFEHDRLWVQEALINIIKNAIEHSSEGDEVEIELTENPVYRRIVVTDRGEGISEEDLPNIFKRFYKAKASKKTNSIGIGLALAKSIIESHNGVIEAESKAETGSRLILIFHKY